MLYKMQLALSKDDLDSGGGKFRKDKNYFTKFWSYVCESTWAVIWKIKDQHKAGDLKELITKNIKVMESTLLPTFKKIDGVNMGITGTWSQLNNLRCWVSEGDADNTPQILFAINFCMQLNENFEKDYRATVNANEGYLFAFFEIKKGLVLVEGELKRLKKELDRRFPNNLQN